VSNTYDAGSIEATLTLDRTDFNTGIRESKASGEDFNKQTYTAKLKLNTAQAKLDILAMKADLDTLRDVNLNIGVTGSNAQIRAISQSASALDGRNIGIGIQLNGFDDALARLRTMRQQVDKLDGRTINIHVNVDGVAAAIAQIGALQAQLNNLNGANARVTTSGNAFTSSLSKMTPGMADLVALAIAAVPALVPLSAAMLSVAGTATAMSVAVGVGVGVWALAMKGAIGNVTALNKTLTTAQSNLATQKKALDQLTPGTKAYANQLEKVEAAQKAVTKAQQAFTPAQKNYVTATTGMKNAWADFTKATQSSTLPVATSFVTTLGLMLPKVVPLVKAMTPEMMAIATSLRSWTTNGGFDSFINTVIDFGVPAFHSLRLAVVAVFTMFGNGYRAFLPQVVGMANHIKDGADKLALWSGGGGFQRFIDYVHKNGPAVHKLMQALGDALGTLGGALKNMGPVGLTTTTMMLRLIGAMSPGQVQLLAYAFIAVRLSMLAYNVYTGIATGLTWAFSTAQGASRAQMLLVNIMMIAGRIQMAAMATWTGIVTAAQWLWNAAITANPIGIMVVAIGILVVAVIAIATKTTWFQTAWHASWNAIQTAFHSVMDFLTSGFLRFGLLILGPIGVLILLGANWRQVWGLMKSSAFAVWNFLQNDIFNPLGRFFTKTIPGWGNTMYVQGFRNPWNSAYKGARDAYNSINNNVFQPIGKFFTKTIPGWAGTMRDKVKSAFTDMKNGIGTIWKGIEKVTAVPINFVINDVYNSGIRKVWNGVAGAVGLKSKSLPSMTPLKYAQGGAITGANVGMDTKTILAHPGEHILTAEEVKNMGGHNAVARMRSMYSSSGSARVAPPQGVSRYGLGGAISGGIGDVIGGTGDLLKAGANAFTGLVRGALGAALDPVLNKLSSTATKGINALIPGSPPLEGLVDGVVTSPIGWLKSYIAADDKKNAGSVGGIIPTGQHKAIIDAALAAAHVPPPGSKDIWEAGLNTLIKRESGWNAGAINRTDSNAKAGHPSQGLAQTIPSTFAHYVPASLRSAGILNPVANVAAAIRYIVSRYGNITHVQQANASKPPMGYAGGGLMAPGLAVVGEHGKELVSTSGSSRAFSAPETKRMLAESSGAHVRVTMPDQMMFNVDGQQMTGFVTVISEKTVDATVSDAARSR
jgi:SLT domain-containing protein